MKLFKIIVSALFVAILFGCGGLGNGHNWPSDQGYPTKNTNAYFIVGRDAPSTFAGLPGYYLGIPDRDIVGKAPNFSYVNGHNGGVGDTLEIQSDVDGIYLEWAYNHLDTIILFGNWSGQVYAAIGQPTGIRIGGSIEAFKTAFPNYQTYDNGTGLAYFTVVGGNYLLKTLAARVDANGVITEISIG